MTSMFACHRGQEVQNLICVNCYAVYQPSCFKRDHKGSHGKYIGGYKVECCSATGKTDTNGTSLQNDNQTSAEDLNLEKLQKKCKKLKRSNEELIQENQNLQTVADANQKLKECNDEMTLLSISLQNRNKALETLIDNSIDEEYTKLIDENSALKKENSDLQEQLYQLEGKMKLDKQLYDQMKSECVETEKYFTKKLTEQSENNLALMKEAQKLGEEIKSHEEESIQNETAKTEMINQANLKQLEIMQKNEDLQNKIYQLIATEERLKGEIRDMQEIKKEMLITIEVLTAENKFCYREVERIKSERAQIREKTDVGERRSLKCESAKGKEKIISLQGEIEIITDEPVTGGVRYQDSKRLAEGMKGYCMDSKTQNGEFYKMMKRLEAQEEELSRKLMEIENRLYERLYEKLKDEKTAGKLVNTKKNISENSNATSKIPEEKDNTTSDKISSIGEKTMELYGPQTSLSRKQKTPSYSLAVTKNKITDETQEKLKNSGTAEVSLIHRLGPQIDSSCERREADKSKKRSPNAETESCKMNNTRISPKNYNNHTELLQWKEAKGKKRRCQSERRQAIFGSQREDDSLKAYIPLSHIHLSKVNLENKEQDIQAFLRQKLPNVDCFVEELTVKSGAYRSFKISVPVTYSSGMLDSKFWPANLVIKKYMEVRGNFRRTTTRTTQN